MYVNQWLQSMWVVNTVRVVFQSLAESLPSMRTKPTNLTLSQDSKGRYFVSVRSQGKRYRYFNGNVLGIELKPNLFSSQERTERAAQLLLAFHEAISSGWTPTRPLKPTAPLSKLLTEYQPAESLSRKYARALSKTASDFSDFLSQKQQASFLPRELSALTCLEYINHATVSPSTYNHERKRLCTLLNACFSSLDVANPALSVPKQRVKQTLHTPFLSVKGILDDVHEYDYKLYLCCLLTYGCLLRPHQEIRTLKWGDFSEHLDRISLAGDRNKSGKIRSVPVPSYVRSQLKPKGREQNIFTGHSEPYNESYFKTLWTRFKRQSNPLEEGQTIYSFRHSAALEIFTRTNSVRAVQNAMGHASPAVTIGYLRGLGVVELTEADMPRL